jgi:Papain family cysteine protease
VEHGLGRRPAPDERDQAYLLSLPTITRTSRFWWGYRVRLDQGQTPQCVAYGWSHFITDSPDPHPAPLIAPATLYHEAQTLDEWPGEDYDGTSVRGGAKALVNHAEIAAEYRWAFDLDTLIANVLEVGPVVIGVNWYERMFDPDSKNYVRIGGGIAGGHCVKVDGVNTDYKFVRIKNSWGQEWGRGGFARITFDDMERLLGEDGEACMAVETSA